MVDIVWEENMVIIFNFRVEVGYKFLVMYYGVSFLVIVLF